MQPGNDVIADAMALIVIDGHRNRRSVRSSFQDSDSRLPRGEMRRALEGCLDRVLDFQNGQRNVLQEQMSDGRTSLPTHSQRCS